MGDRLPGSGGDDAARRRRAHVVATAARVFGERGYRATSMRELADAVGISKPALYYYVRSKEELLVRLYEDALAQRLAEQAEVRAADLAPDEAVRRILVQRFLHACHNQELTRVFFEEERELPAELLTTVQERRAQAEAMVAQLIEDGVEAGLFALTVSPRLAARALGGAVASVHRWYDREGPRSAESLAEDFAEFLLAALRPGAAGWSAAPSPSRRARSGSRSARNAPGVVG